MQKNIYKKLFMTLMMLGATSLTAMHLQEVKTTAAGVAAMEVAADGAPAGHKRRLSASAEEGGRASKKAKVAQQAEEGVIFSKSWEQCPAALCNKIIEMAGESVIDFDEVRSFSGCALPVGGLITFACDTTGRWLVHASHGSEGKVMLSLVDLNENKKSCIRIVPLLAQDIIFRFSADAKKLMAYSAQSKMLWVWDVDTGALSHQTSSLQGALLYADGEKIITHQRAAHTVQMYDVTVAAPTVRMVPLPGLDQFNVVGQLPVAMTSIGISNITRPLIVMALSPNRVLFFDPETEQVMGQYTVPLTGLVSILSMDIVKAAGSAEVARLVITGRREMPTSGAAFTAVHPLKRSQLSTVLVVVNMQTAEIFGGLPDIVDCFSNKLISYSADKSLVTCFQHKPEGLTRICYNIFTGNTYAYPYMVVDKDRDRILDILPVVSKSGALELAILKPHDKFSRYVVDGAPAVIGRSEVWDGPENQFQYLHAHALAGYMVAQAPDAIGFFTSIGDMVPELAKLPVKKQRLFRHVCCSKSFREEPLEITGKKLARFPEALQRIMMMYGTKIVAGTPRPQVGKASVAKAAKTLQALVQAMSLGGHGSSGQLSAGDRVAALSGTRQEPGRGFAAGSAASTTGTTGSGSKEMDLTED